MFKNVFAPPRFRPAVNVGCLMDVMTGKYELGKHGESIMNGGVSGMTGIAARPNNFKTYLVVYLLAMLRRSCHGSHSLIYDSEGTLNPIGRFNSVSRHYDYLRDINYEEDEQFSFTDLSQYTGDEFFDLFKKVLKEKGDNAKAFEKTTPFIDKEGNKRKALYPSSVTIDSFSRLQTAAVEKIYDKNSIGDSGANTDAMTNGKAKKQMFNQMPGICSRSGAYLFMTAHVKDVINIEMYPTDKRNLSYMKKDTVLEGVSGGFYSLPNNVWMIVSNKPLQNKDKMPEYPWDNSKSLQGDTDLVEISMMNLRGKNGISGIPITIIVSQSEGILAPLTEFHYCKENNRWGLEGNLQNYAMVLYPDVKLSRTTVRQKLDKDYKLQRAVQFSAELLQLHQFHRDLDPGLLCTVEELYKDLKDLGYDWDQLLNTRGYWVFEEEEKEHPLPFLSTMDLLKMRKKEYIPFWFSKEDKAKLKLA